MENRFFAGSELASLRRLDYAAGFNERGEFDAAIEIYKSITIDWPEWVIGWFEYAKALDAQSQDPRPAFQTCLKLDPEDALGAGLHLARLGALPDPEAPPPAYVQALFDDYAPRFEEALLGDLQYHAPERLAALIEKKLKAKPQSQILDLGCGTGLMGEYLAPFAATLDGVDLSSEMIALAEQKSIYQNLHIGEAVDWLQCQNNPYDSIVAADVFSYFGALDAVINASAQRLNRGGILAFTVEKGRRDEDWYLRDSLRYAHHQSYVETCLQAASLSLLAIETAPLRQDAGEDVMGLYVLAQNHP